MSRRQAALPFRLKRKQEVLGSSSITSTKETVHGLLRLDGDELTVQWRLTRKTEHVGKEIRTDEEFGDVFQIVLPLDSIAGAVIRQRWWELGLGPSLVLTAADLMAFEDVAGEGGLRLSHPAELVLRLRRRDRLAGEEFAAEMALALAELEATPPRPSLEAHQEPRRLE
jgi:hypothetical protein